MEAADKEEEEQEEETGGVSLTTIMKENPKLSVQEALAKLVIMKQMAGVPAGGMGRPGGPPGAPGLAMVGGLSLGGAPPLAGLTHALGATNSTAAAAALAAAKMPAVMQQTKTMREVFVKGLPAGVTSAQIQEFLTTIVKAVKGRDVTTTPVVNTWLSADGSVGFCETRSVDDAEALVTCCDGVSLAGSTLKLGRPKASSSPNDALATASHAPIDPALTQGATASPLVVSSNVVMLMNVPRHLSALQIQEFLVCAFGNVKKFNVLLDTNGKSKGSVVFRYADDKVTANAVAAIAGIRLGDEVLQLQRVPPAMIDTLLTPVKAGELVPVSPHDPAKPSPVVCLRNVVATDDLADDQAYHDLTEDILEECAKYATVSAVHIPRHNNLGLTKKAKKRCSGLGRVFVEYESTDDAKTALAALQKRTIDDKPMAVGFYPRDLFKKHILHSEPLPTLPTVARAPAPAEDGDGDGVIPLGSDATSPEAPNVAAPEQPPPRAAVAQPPEPINMDVD